MEVKRELLELVIDAWDSTVLPKANDGLMQERMEDLRAALAAPATAPEPPRDAGLMPLIEDYAKAVHDGDDAACLVLKKVIVASL